MKKEAKILLDKAVDSLILSVEHFNSPFDRGRTDAVLIFLDHAFEMLLKSAILHRGGKIRVKTEKQTIGFDHCTRKILSEAKLKFLSEKEVLILQAINSLRDAAQHHYLKISEQHLYLQAQTGLSLFKKTLERVFKYEKLKLPPRVLPLSTTPPLDLISVYENEVADIRKLLRPKARKQIEAISRLRALAITDGAIKGEKVQPSDADLQKISDEIKKGKTWDKIFSGISTINVTSKGFGPSMDFQISKKEGVPIQLVPEGTPGAHVVAVKRINELGFYNLNLHQLASKVGLTSSVCLAFISFLKLQSDPECFMPIKLGSASFKRYSQKTIAAIDAAKKKNQLEEAWEFYKQEIRKKQKERKIE